MTHLHAAALAAAAVLLAGLGPARADGLPGQLMRQLPQGYSVLGDATASFGTPRRTIYIVALGHADEASFKRGLARSPARPLLLFERRPDGTIARVGRNDAVIMRADEGGQCDPFLDGGATIAVRGAYFTIENGVACGTHWTDYVTFRFEAARGQFVFDNERYEAWRLNPSDDPGAEALVRDGPQIVRRDSARHPVAFANWRPATP